MHVKHKSSIFAVENNCWTTTYWKPTLKTLKESDEVELLGIAIDKALNLKRTYWKFMLHCPEQTSCLNTNQKIVEIK